MNKVYASFVLAFSTFCLVSFSTNPPDGKTGAPGENLCTECHVQTNPPINGTIEVQGFPNSITPGQMYLLTVVNRNTVGNAVRGGFQMTILGPTNTKAGEFSSPSGQSAIANFNNRQYFEHNPAVEYPDSNVVKWTVQWTAPSLPSGSLVTWYIAGNIANGNFQNTGDRIVAANGGGIITLTGIHEPDSSTPTLYPNPGNNLITVELKEGTPPDGRVYFYSMNGAIAGSAMMVNGNIDVPDLSAGVYILRIVQGEKSHLIRWSKI